jgi:hypothetical protein
MAETGDRTKLTELAVKLKEAIQRSIAKPWVKERYSPPVGETPSELRDLLKRLDEQPYNSVGEGGLLNNAALNGG